jgi:sugar phosphate isomerase/epimerase
MMHSRRTFLQLAAAGPAAALMARDFASVKLGAQTNAWPIKPGDLSAFFDVLNKIKGFGFQGFETGFANLRSQFNSPEETKRRIAATQLEFFGIHIFLTQYDPETHIAPPDLYEPVARGGASLGAQRLILSGAPASNESGLDQGALSKKVAALNQAGQYAKSVGLRLAAYHNHAPEFAHEGAEITALMRDTDSAAVGFLLDAGHAYEAGADIPEFFSRHHQRIIGLHLRDYKNGEQVPLGSGTFPLQELASAIQRSNWQGWILCEEERLKGKPGDTAMRPARDALFHVFRGES